MADQREHAIRIHQDGEAGTPLKGNAGPAYREEGGTVVGILYSS